MNTSPPLSPIGGLRHRLCEHLEIIYPGEDQETIAAELMEGLVALLRASDRTLTPLCSWVAAYLRDHPEHHDLVA